MSRIGKKPVTLPKGVKVSVHGAEAVVEGAKGKLSCPIPTGITLDVQADRLGIAREFAIRHGVFVVLKGYRTLIVTPEGAVSINPTGNPGMATAGSGDVLAGMLGAWCAQLLDGEVACDVAVYLHGLAGDLAEADEGPQAMTATDILAHISDAMLDVSAKRKVPPSAEAGT